ncbi:L-aminoadipate-semialdehyde dehydrogenase [Mytilus galloprovincialis]|uniref:L-aminoadipate-semialdehyde dehydrogenase n=1 Tax=Mytilus galloprovincialis TaxID=29158 RepID=A0A8B6H0L4_MYTGA|nr:L-aminoadipate-semialdehyde dehydrogenase [Mytilus galloprovincialis]
MVRETTEAHGLGRIIENLRRYINLWKFSYSTRVAVVISDLSQEKLGIAPDIYNALCNAIDVVFMNAAMMNFNTNYEDHRIANVDSTKEFVKFAMTGVQKYIFQTSSLSVFLFPPEPKTVEPQHRMCYESDFFDDPCAVEGGYGQSKWASEKIVMEAIDHLPGGAIFRPARISGCSVTGSGPKNDLFASTLIGMRKFGYYPDMDFPFDLTPVDFCAKAMVEIAVRICNESNRFPKAYHLFNSKTFPFRDIFKGMDLKPLPLNDWREKLKTASAEYKELIPLTPFFMSQFWDRAAYWPIFDTSNTDKMISKETKDLMLHSTELLEVYKTLFWNIVSLS